MKAKKKILFTIVAIIILSNIPLISALIDVTFTTNHYKYSNFDGSHTTYEFWSRTFSTMKTMHESCISFHPKQKDKNLYRLFRKDPLAFWRWGSYFYDEKYTLPYKNWKEIERKRSNKKAEEGCSIQF